MSIKVNTKIGVGPALYEQRDWVSIVGGQWAGRWDKGIIVISVSGARLKMFQILIFPQPDGQDSQLVVKDLATRSDASYLLQTNDDLSAHITTRSRGWRTGPKDVLERLNDPTLADTIPANQYKFRLTVELETGDERYAFLNTCLWTASGSRRLGESEFFSFGHGSFMVSHIFC